MFKKSCVSCHSTLPPHFSWKKALTLEWLDPQPLLSLEEWFCESCRQKMDKLSEECAKCSRSLVEIDSTYIYEMGTIRICYDCVRWKYWEEEQGLDSILVKNWSLFTYNAWFKQWMEQYKFRRDERLKFVAASFLLELWQTKVQQELSAENIHIDYIVPIPLSEERMKERGFNQSSQIATLLSKRLDIPYKENLLIRRLNEEKQSKKDRVQRLEELFFKFIKNPAESVDISNMNILLIDDIYTTGATLHAAAYTLIHAGAKHIFSLTIAR